VLKVLFGIAQSGLQMFSQLFIYIFLIIIFFVLIFFNLGYLFYSFENIETLLKLVELFFTPFLPADFATLADVHLAREDADCQSAIDAIVGHHQTMVKAIFDTAKVVSHIVRDLHSFNHVKNLTDVERDNLIKQIQFNAGCLWVLCGMCLLEISTSVSPVDPLQKSQVRFECYKAEVKYSIK